MRPIRLSVGAAGSSPWSPVNVDSHLFAIGLGYIPTNGAVLTSKVQHTFDNPQSVHPVSVSRAGTVATVIDKGSDGNGHGLAVADSAIILNSGSVTLDGTFSVATIVDANTYTYTVANTGPTVDQGQTQGAGLRVFDHASMVGMTVRADGNYAFNIQAMRLTCTAYTSGRADLMILQGTGR